MDWHWTSPLLVLVPFHCSSKIFLWWRMNSLKSTFSVMLDFLRGSSVFIKLESPSEMVAARWKNGPPNISENEKRRWVWVPPGLSTVSLEVESMETVRMRSGIKISIISFFKVQSFGQSAALHSTASGKRVQ